MDKPKRQWKTILKNLLFYVVLPFSGMAFLSGPIGRAACESDPSAFWILFTASALVCLNWLVYHTVHRKCPSLLVFAHGIFCLLLVVIIEYEMLPGYLPRYYSLTSTLAMTGGCLALAFLFLLSFWLASRRSKFAHAAAVMLWVIIGLIATLIAYQAIRDIEGRNVNLNTWLSIVILAAMIPAAFSRRILAARRDAKKRSRAIGVTDGRIIQVIGETHLDRDDDLVTDYHARVQYTVDGTLYMTRTVISKMTMRKYGKKAFVGQEITVRYDPENPDYAFTGKIDREFCKQLRPDFSEEDKDGGSRDAGEQDGRMPGTDE